MQLHIGNLPGHNLHGNSGLTFEAELIGPDIQCSDSVPVAMVRTVGKKLRRPPPDLSAPKHHARTSCTKSLPRRSIHHAGFPVLPVWALQANTGQFFRALPRRTRQLPTKGPRVSVFHPQRSSPGLFVAGHPRHLTRHLGSKMTFCSSR